MEKIISSLKIGIAKNVAFEKFINDLNEWWPKEYTWSQEKLKKISIDGKINGLCTEIGPHGFRCDWGRVTELSENEKIGLKWQIGPNREPVPNPEMASDLEIKFEDDNGSTTVKLEHKNFEKHGDGAEGYRKMMNTKQGWEYILKAYKNYCEK